MYAKPNLPTHPEPVVVHPARTAHGRKAAALASVDVEEAAFRLNRVADAVEEKTRQARSLRAYVANRIGLRKLAL